MHLYRSKPNIPSSESSVQLGNFGTLKVSNDKIIFPKNAVTFKPAAGEISDRPINHNLVMKNASFVDAPDAQFKLTTNPYIIEEPFIDVFCNSVVNGKDTYQLISVYQIDVINGLGYLPKNAFKYYPELQEIYDLEGLFTTSANDAQGWYCFGYNPKLEVISLPFIDTVSEYFIGPQMPALRVVELNKCTTIGNPAGINWFNRVQFGANYTLNNALKTVNAGAMHAGVQWAIDSNGAKITWVD